MKNSDVLEKQGFGEARKNGGHNLYLRVRLRCAVGGHIVEKDFTVDAWDEEMRKSESWVCPNHFA